MVSETVITSRAAPAERVLFGGGCFWCTEAVFKMLRGVVSVMPGYAGGAKANPTYEEVSGGNTGHAEVVEVTYDPSLIEFADLLAVFFGSHDPTTKDRQGNDRGTQYRSVIFCNDTKRLSQAEAFVSDINASNTLGAPIVTEVLPMTEFYPAEDYHQNYAARNGQNPYCELVINPKLEKVQEKFANLLKEEEWKARLTPEQYRVLRDKGTEAPFSGKLGTAVDGAYTCMACGNPLFSADAKFDSGTGWPSFDQSLPGSITESADDAHGMHRVEVTCSRCGSHLGHVFDDGPTATGKRYCINSVCLG